MFVYLDGAPSPKSIDALNKNYRLRPLVCLTGAWEEYIKQTFPNAFVCNRYMMKPSCRFRLDREMNLPEGFTVTLFDEKAFALHPFSHGENYPSFSAFRELVPVPSFGTTEISLLPRLPLSPSIMRLNLIFQPKKHIAEKDRPRHAFRLCCRIAPKEEFWSTGMRKMKFLSIWLKNSVLRRSAPTVYISCPGKLGRHPL